MHVKTASSMWLHHKGSLCWRTFTVLKIRTFKIMFINWNKLLGLGMIAFLVNSLSKVALVWKKIIQVFVIQRKKKDLIVIQIYVDDILSVALTNPYVKTSKLMKKEFEMSMIGKLTLFLGIQKKDKTKCFCKSILVCTPLNHVLLPWVRPPK